MWLPIKSLVFVWHGSYYSTHHTARVSDWAFAKNRDFLLVEMFSSISQPISAFSQLDFNHGHFFHIHIHQASHVLYVNL